jgi:hypothetical protein
MGVKLDWKYLHLFNGYELDRQYLYLFKGYKAR